MVLRALIIGKDAALRRHLRAHLDALAAVQVIGEVTDPQEATEMRLGRPDTAFVGVPDGPEGSAALAALARLPRQLPGVSVVAVGPGGSTDLVIQALRAGAVEFLRYPASREDVVGAVEKVARLRPSAPPLGAEPGEITAVYGAKGGLGVTTLATNLAVCLALREPGQVLLADFDVRHGAVATFLNLKPTYSTVDALSQSDRLDEPLLRGLLIDHPSGLRVLAAPPGLSRAQLEAGEVTGALRAFRSQFAHVILDLPHDVEPGTAAALDEADHILYLVGLNVPALRASAAGLTALRHLGVDQRKVKVIVVRADAREEVNLRGVREVLGVPVFWRTLSDYPTVVASLNQGQPVVVAAPRTPVARNLRELVDRLSRNGSGKDPGGGWLPGLFRRILTQSA
jgi:pilus assembly protein CpaE